MNEFAEAIQANSAKSSNGTQREEGLRDYGTVPSVVRGTSLQFMFTASANNSDAVSRRVHCFCS